MNWNRMIGNWSACTCAGFVAVAICNAVALGQETHPSALPKAEELIEKSIEALGGRAAMEKIKSRISHGRVEIEEMGIKGTVVNHERAPDLYHTLADLGAAGKMEGGSNGKVYWEVTSAMGPRILEGAEKAQNQRLNTFNAPLHWRKLYTKAETTGTGEVDGKPTFKVVFTPAVGKPETVHYDQKSYLPLQLDMIATLQMGEAPVEVSMKEYRKVDGVLLPHVTQQRMLGVTQTITIEKVEHNLEIPDSRFDLPEPIQALLAKGRGATTGATTGPTTRPTTRPTPQTK